MAVTVKTICTAVRDRHPAFDQRRTPDAAILRFLSGYQKLLQSKALQRNKHALLTQLDVALPLADFAAGFTLPANQYVHGQTATALSGDAIPFTLVDPTLRLHATPFPGGWVDATRQLKLVGMAADWTGYSKVTVGYVPVPADFTALANTIVLPDEAQQAFIDAAAAFMFGRGHTDKDLPPITPAHVMLAQKMAAQTEGEFLDSLGRRRVGKVFQVQSNY